MPLQSTGNTKDTSLVEILRNLHERRATGTLTVRSGAMAKSLYLKDGRIVFATSTEPEDRLGEVLIREGKLTREQLEIALERTRKIGGLKKLGAILVEAGFVAPNDLFSGLKSQVKDIICSLFLEHEAVFSFEELLPGDIIHLQFNMEELIMEIIQRIKQKT